MCAWLRCVSAVQWAVWGADDRWSSSLSVTYLSLSLPPPSLEGGLHFSPVIPFLSSWCTAFGWRSPTIRDDKGDPSSALVPHQSINQLLFYEPPSPPVDIFSQWLFRTALYSFYFQAVGGGAVSILSSSVSGLLQHDLWSTLSAPFPQVTTVCLLMMTRMLSYYH